MQVQCTCPKTHLLPRPENDRHRGSSRGHVTKPVPVMWQATPRRRLGTGSDAEMGGGLRGRRGWGFKGSRSPPEQHPLGWGPGSRGQRPCRGSLEWGVRPSPGPEPTSYFTARREAAARAVGRGPGLLPPPSAQEGLSGHLAWGTPLAGWRTRKGPSAASRISCFWTK